MPLISSRLQTYKQAVVFLALIATGWIGYAQTTERWLQREVITAEQRHGQTSSKIGQFNIDTRLFDGRLLIDLSFLPVSPIDDIPAIGVAIAGCKDLNTGAWSTLERDGTMRPATQTQISMFANLLVKIQANAVLDDAADGKILLNASSSRTAATSFSGGFIREVCFSNEPIAVPNSTSGFPVLAGSTTLVIRALGQANASNKLYVIGFAGLSNEIRRTVAFQISDEYFNGEFDFFAKYGGQGSYAEKAIALFGCLFNEPEAATEKTAFREMVRRSFQNGIQWDMFSGVAEAEMNTALVNLANMLRQDYISGMDLFPVQWNNQTAYIPYARSLDNQDSFRSLYGHQRSLYRMLYDQFHFQLNKPLFSAKLRQELSRTGMDANYQYQDYRQIDAEEGRSLAEAAMRYLTWGLEYSLRDYSGVATTLDDPENFVTAPLLFRRYPAFFTGWISSTNLALRRSGNNYLPAATDLRPIAASSEGWLSPDCLQSIRQSLIAAAYTTPFPDARVGWPLPYAPSGIDSPRTFAYKLMEQWRVRTAITRFSQTNAGTTLAYSENPSAILLQERYIARNVTDSSRRLSALEDWILRAANYMANYVSIKEITKNENLPGGTYIDGAYVRTSAPDNRLKPFMPWRDQNNRAIEEFAGVDSMGMLTGAIAQSGFAARVFDLEGQRPAVNLDRYNQLSSDNAHLAGLDAAGLPAVRIGGLVNPLSIGNYRFTMADLERSSLVIPDLSLLQVGDLIVRYGSGERLATAQRSGYGTDMEKEPTQVGIVVHINDSLRPAYGGDATDFLAGVTVVSIREGFQQVTLGTWGNPAVGSFGGFAYEPGRYHARRLLVQRTDLSTQPSTPTTGAVAWDVFSGQLIKGSLAFVHYGDHSSPASAPSERWIPNTGQYLQLSGIMVNLTDESGRQLDPVLDLAGQELCLAGAIDRAWKADSNWATDGNIWRNRGVGFEFVAQPEGGFENQAAVVLAHFLRQDSGAAYQVFYPTGSPLEAGGGGRLALVPVTDGGPDAWQLVLVLASSGSVSSASNGQFRQLASFGIRPLAVNGETGYPGDDILLCLSIGPANVATGNLIVANDRDYFAVYDKKMLWRANLYVAEGGMDWNEVRNWNAPPALANENSAPKWWQREWGYNEWNRIDNGENYVADIATLPVGEGRQEVTILSWTRYDRDFGADDTRQVFHWTGAEPTDPPARRIVRSAVAYNTATWDSPFDFNRKLWSYRLYVANRPWPAGSTAPTLTQGQAPGLWGSYYNYEYLVQNPNPAEASTSQLLIDGTYHRLDEGTSATTEMLALVSQPVLVDQREMFPYRPQYAAIERYSMLAGRTGSQAMSGSGLDCIDLLTRALMYQGNRYQLGLYNDSTIIPDTGCDWRYTGRTPYRQISAVHQEFSSDICGIVADSNLSVAAEFYAADTRDRPEVWNLVPGDILVMRMYPRREPGDPPPVLTYPHVAVVQSVNDQNNNGVLEACEIVLIESASGNPEGELPENSAMRRGVHQYPTFSMNAMNTDRYYRVLNQTLLSSYLHGGYYNGWEMFLCRLRYR